MNVKYFALVAGIIFVLIGLAGFVPAFVSAPPAGAPDVTVHANHGYLLGIFAVNVLHNTVHILFGVWGLLAYMSFSASINFARGMGIIYAILAVMGIFPSLYTVFGLIPIHGNDVWLHFALAAAGAFFGWIYHPTDTGHHYDVTGGTPHHA